MDGWTDFGDGMHETSTTPPRAETIRALDTVCEKYQAPNGEGRLKRKLALREDELRCYRELCPNRIYQPPHVENGQQVPGMLIESSAWEE